MCAAENFSAAKRPWKFAGLPGFANRRHFEDPATPGLQSSYCKTSLAALVVLVVDYFKRLNETYGSPCRPIAKA
ncbi:diguanylate cyclase domain-containing protein [Bosea beijingensis]|uniref:diguanylate cyclase domain-containing protein n=1 Tax=Bosea beijingensis TaxID=3068632 RepID=UPI003BEEC3B0